ncbi:hypothetical protein VTH06DRAFT_5320, partial [Thermothelomyces fergusii]
MGKKPSGFSIPGFIPLAPSIYVQDARLAGDGYTGGGSDATFSVPSPIGLSQGPAVRPGNRSRDAAPPDLIVITSWTGAAAKHVAKYTSAYNGLYPSVPILLITTSVSDLVLRSTEQKLKALAPAVAYLLSGEGGPTAASPYPAHTASFFSFTSFSFSSSVSFPFPSALSSQQYDSSPGHPYHSYHAYQIYQPAPAPALAPAPSPAPGPTRPRFSSLLLHAFSEGGAHKAVLLARA